MPLREARDDGGRGNPNNNANNSSRNRQGHSLDQELSKNVTRFGAYGLAKSNLARTLSNRYQHDIHDADPANDKRDGSNRCEHQRQDA